MDGDDPAPAFETQGGVAHPTLCTAYHLKTRLLGVPLACEHTRTHILTHCGHTRTHTHTLRAHAHHSHLFCSHPKLTRAHHFATIHAGHHPCWLLLHHLLLERSFADLRELKHMSSRTDAHGPRSYPVMASQRCQLTSSPAACPSTSTSIALLERAASVSLQQQRVHSLILITALVTHASRLQASVSSLSFLDLDENTQGVCLPHDEHHCLCTC
jgi:hypothetical protein